MSSNRNKNSTPNVTKSKPTIFPLGFGIGKVEDSFVIVDFYDKNFEGDSDSLTIIESIAMPRSRALELIKALQSVVDSDDEE